jgi:hypothetical protein
VKPTWPPPGQRRESHIVAAVAMRFRVPEAATVAGMSPPAISDCDVTHHAPEICLTQRADARDAFVSGRLTPP